MYVSPSNAWDDDAEIRALVRTVGAAELITVGPGGYPLATTLPLVWVGETVRAHFARANPHWHAIEAGQPTLLVCRGAQAYVSPSWYPAKTEHGRVVPTWNYSAVHLTGRARIIEDPDWLRAHVEALTGIHEDHRDEPWHVADAPESFVTGQLRGIVGVEVVVEQVQGKAKLSQNRSAADRAGVVAGLRAEPGPEAGRVAAEMSPAPREAQPRRRSASMSRTESARTSTASASSSHGS